MNRNYAVYKTTFIDDMRSLVEEAAQNFPDRTALSYKVHPSDQEVVRVSFPQWRDDVRNLGTALITKGFREKNIALIGENSYGWCCAFFAVMAIGSVLVPIDKDLAPEDIAGIIDATGCVAAIVGKAAREKCEGILPARPSIQAVYPVAELPQLEAEAPRSTPPGTTPTMITRSTRAAWLPSSSRPAPPARARASCSRRRTSAWT